MKTSSVICGKRFWPVIMFSFWASCFTVDCLAGGSGKSVKKVGQASWYGPGFHGRKTANGEIFNQHKLTAAHRSLPLGSIAVVTNLKNGKKVKVKINDRGPYAKGRAIDLSRAAAKRLGIEKAGVAKVKIEALPSRSRVSAAESRRQNRGG